MKYNNSCKSFKLLNYLQKIQIRYIQIKQNKIKQNTKLPKKTMTFK